MRGHHSQRNLLEQSIIVYLLRYLTASRLTARNIQTTSQENVFSFFDTLGFCQPGQELAGGN